MEIKRITAYDRSDFRKWLEKNHDKETKVAIILHKRHTGKPAPTHRELWKKPFALGGLTQQSKD